MADTVTTSDFDMVQERLLKQISEVVQSNRRLEDDLVLTRYKLEEQAQELDSARVEARTDQLSGLYNRKAFDETLQFMLSKYKRADVAFALVLADVDHFKRINDTHGHQSGDKVVSLLGQTFISLVRPSDHVARFGGDEFALLLTGLSAKDAHHVASRIRDSIERTNFAVGSDGARLAVTVSMGMAFPKETDTVNDLFDRADQALYRSKESGRNQLQVNYGDAEERQMLPA